LKIKGWSPFPKRGGGKKGGGFSPYLQGKEKNHINGS